MSTHLFFDIIIAFIITQVIAISEFLNACKIRKSSDCSFSYSIVMYLSSSSIKNLIPQRCFFKFGNR